MLWSFQAVFLCKPGECLFNPPPAFRFATSPHPPAQLPVASPLTAYFLAPQIWSTLSALSQPAPWLPTRRCEARSLQVRAPASRPRLSQLD